MWPRPEIASALTKALHIELRDLYDFTPTRLSPDNRKVLDILSRQRDPSIMIPILGVYTVQLWSALPEGGIHSVYH